MGSSGTETTTAAARKTLRTCVCCGSTRLTRLRDYACEDPYFAARVHPTLDVLQCASCGLAQVDHVHLDATEFEDWVRRQGRSRRPPSRTAYAWFEARGRALAELSRRHHDGGRVDRIFQFGAGPGFDLVALQNVHRSAECWADRLDDEAAWRSLAQPGTLAEGPFDRIVVTHVLGHVPDPVTFVRRAIAQLRSGGLLMVEVGNDLETALDVRRAFEPQLTFFTLATVRKLFATNFAQDLEEVHAATAGPRVGELQPELDPPAEGFWRRLFGKSTPVKVDVTDDAEATDRAFARIVLRRLPARAAEDRQS